MRMILIAALLLGSCDQLAQDARAEQAMVHQLDGNAPSTDELMARYYHEDRLCPGDLEGVAYYRNRHCSEAEKLATVLDARGYCLMENRFYVQCDVNRPYEPRH